MTHYRIKEYNGQFIIEGSFNKKTTIRWFKKKLNIEVIWSSLNSKHEPMFARATLERFPPPMAPPLMPFNTKHEAVSYINLEILKTKPKKNNSTKYHYTDTFKDGDNISVRLRIPSGGSTYETA